MVVDRSPMERLAVEEHLAAAVALDDPALFDDFVAWAKVMLASRGIGEIDLIENLHAVGRSILAAGKTTEVAFLTGAISRVGAMSANVASFLARETPLNATAKSYLDAILAGRRGEADNLLARAIADRATLQDLYLHVFEPVQHEIGRLWQINRISVAQEHFCTAAVQRTMSSLYGRLFAGRPGRRRVVAACAGGELHEIGLRMVTDLLELNGWDTVYLGANVPVESVIRTVCAAPTSLVAISATLTPSLTSARDLIRQLRSDPETASIPILAGGYPFRVSDAIAGRIGADAWALNAADAVARAEQLAAEVDIASLPGTPRPDDADPAIEPAPRLSPGEPPERLSVELWEDLTRLNNEVETTHRRLAKSNAELRWLNDQKNQLLGMAAHDLRNPLGGIIAYAGFLLDEAHTLSPDQAGLITGILTSAETMLELVEDVVDFTAVESGTVRLSPSSFALAPLVDEVLAVCRMIAARKQIAISVSVDPTTPPLLADRKKIAQVVDNLVTNAIKFSDARSQVLVSAGAAPDGGVWLAVKDHGTGMDESQIEQLFTPFAQVGPAPTAGEKSTGLGLAIVSRIVTAHRGRIAVESTPGRGSTFTVFLPPAEAS